MSFHYFLEEIYGKEHCVRFGDQKSVDSFLKGSSTPEEAVISGHVPIYYYDGRLDLAQRLILSFVREPLAREISSLQHSRATDFPENHSIRQHLESGGRASILYEEPTLRNTQCSFFTPERTATAARERIIAENVFVFDVSWIGVVARVIKTVNEVPYFPQVHNSFGSDPHLESDQDLRLAVDRYCREDALLFKWVMENQADAHTRLRTRLGLRQ